jgi:hypothetical protein
MDYLALIDRKLNPPETPAGAPPQPTFPGAPRVFPLSEDAKSQLRGELVSLRTELTRVLPRAGDRATTLHLQGAINRISRILDPND